MKVARLLWASAGCVAAMLALSAWSFPRLPETAIAVHWGLDGRPNGYAGKATALLLAPAIAAVMSLLLATLPQIMPKRANLERSALAYGVTWIGLMLMLCVSHAVVIAKALGQAFDVVHPLIFSVAVLMLAIGNYMGKVRYNYVFGVRTPWTLADERVWDKTHRLAGRCMAASALVLTVAALLAPETSEGDGFLVTATALCAIGPAVAATIYSILISQRTE